jgi:WD40 repeat protein
MRDVVMVTVGLIAALPALAADAPEPMALKGHKATVVGLAFTADGRTMASWEERGGLKLWAMPKGTERPLEVKIDGQPLALSADGKSLVLADNTAVLLCDLANGKTAKLGTHHSRAGFAAFTPDGKSLITATYAGVQGEIKMWDVAAKKESGTQLTLPTELVGATFGHAAVQALAVSPDGKTLATGHHIANANPSDWHSGKVRLWDQATGKERRVCETRDFQAASLTFLPDSKTLVAAGEARNGDSILLIDVETGKVKSTFAGSGARSRSLVVTPDGNYLASVSEGSVIRIWHVPSGKVRATVIAHSFKKPVAAVAFSPDVRLLVATCDEDKDNAVRMWDVARLLEKK